MSQRLAHIADDGREQTVAAHLEGTAQLCAGFASAFGASEQGYLAGLAHDIGKYSDAFQRRLRGGRIVDHSTAGAVECARKGALPAACCVAGHHGGLPDGGNQSDSTDDATLCGRLKRGIAGKIEAYADWDGVLPSPPPPSVSAGDPLALSFWTRMLYSCLVDADGLDTMRFMEGADVQPPAYDDLPTLMQRLQDHISGWWPPKTDLNRIRCDILQACLSRAEQPKGLYTLTVPTGGGKTIASLAFALRHAVQHGMARVIYVIPYTSIIEQNAAVFREILGAQNVLEHHSGVSFETGEGASPAQYQKSFATENWDAPVVVTTSVQFFESLYGNRSSKCRKLHRLANSVIVFDEAQMLPTAHLRPCVAGIANLAAHFGATAVLCTATQPVLGDLFREFAPALAIQEIMPETHDLYAQFRRVTFRSIGTTGDAALSAELSEQKQVLCIVNSRKAAQALYQGLPAEGSFHLSTLMYPAHRRAMLQEIRERLVQGLTCRVVSTSLIEAGVDVDFPLVYREMAGLDSILQAAGRCNREGRRHSADCTVTIFTREDAPPLIFGTQIGAAKEALAGGAALDDPETVALYFSKYLEVAGKLDKNNVIDAFRTGISGCDMPFRAVAEKFHLIDEDTKTVYIPLKQGAAYAQLLLGGQVSKQLYRQAGRYAVSIYNQHYQALLGAGDLTPLDGDSAVLTNLVLYDEKTGLSLDADSGKALFI